MAARWVESVLSGANCDDVSEYEDTNWKDRSEGRDHNKRVESGDPERK